MTTERTHLIEHVREGMQVVDGNGDKLGKVEFVQMGEPEAATTRGTDQNPLNAQLPKSVISGISEAVSGTEPAVPEAERAQLMRHGFIKIDRSLWHADRYARADQIGEVAGDTVTLQVLKDDLTKVG